MSETTIASGSDFMVFVEEGTTGAETYRPVAGQTNCTLQRGANYRETSNKNLAGYKDFFQGLKDWTATVDMDVPVPSDVVETEIGFTELQDFEDAGTKPTFVFCWVKPMTGTNDTPEPDLTKRMYRGKGLVSCPFNAPSGENATTSIAIQGCRQLEHIDPT